MEGLIKLEPVLAQLSGKTVVFIYTDAYILLEGYSDGVGDMEYNLALSRRRAESIAFYLMNNFLVDSSRVVWNWYGLSDPVASNASSGGRAENRRVEIAVGGLQ